MVMPLAAMAMAVLPFLAVIPRGCLQQQPQRVERHQQRRALVQCNSQPQREHASHCGESGDSDRGKRQCQVLQQQERSSKMVVVEVPRDAASQRTGCDPSKQ